MQMGTYRAFSAFVSSLTQPLATAVKKDGGYVRYCTVHCTHYHWDFNPGQTLFLRKEHHFLNPTIVQKFIYFILLMKKCFIQNSLVVQYVYSMNPSLYRAVQGMEEVIFQERQHFGHLHLPTLQLYACREHNFLDMLTYMLYIPAFCQGHVVDLVDCVLLIFLLID